MVLRNDDLHVFNSFQETKYVLAERNNKIVHSKLWTKCFERYEVSTHRSWFTINSSILSGL